MPLPLLVVLNVKSVEHLFAIAVTYNSNNYRNIFILFTAL